MASNKAFEEAEDNSEVDSERAPTAEVLSLEQATSSHAVQTDDFQDILQRRIASCGNKISSYHPSRLYLMDATEADESCVCCSYSRLCDVLGNRQGKFIEALRPVRSSVNEGIQALLCFRMELERGIRLSPEYTVQKVADMVKRINCLIANETLNIPPDENDLLRTVNFDLVVLLRILTEVQELCDVIQGVPNVNSAAALRTVTQNVDDHSLKERIASNTDSLQHLMRWIDKKTERRWWLKDFINFLQVFIKLALFISASVSVVYHEYQTAPIVTLTITIVQGIVEMLDQFFVKNTQPREIKLSVISSTLPTSKKTGS